MAMQSEGPPNDGGTRLPQIYAHRAGEAARLLHQRGVELIDVAAVLRCSTSAISHYLVGRRQAPPRFFAAVEALTDGETAEQVRQLIPGAVTP